MRYYPHLAFAMVTSDTCELLKYILNGHSLKSKAAARHIWDAEQLAQKSYLCMDFTGIIAEDLSIEFVTELFRLDCREYHAGPWLTPINYSREVGVLLGGCLFKLRKRRESSLLEGFVKVGLITETRGG